MNRNSNQIDSPVAQRLNLRRFLSVTSLYAIGDLVTKSARFILIPYYAHVLTKAELGTLGVLQAISIASWTLFAASCGFAVPRYYFEARENGDRFVASLWWARLVLALGPCLLLIAVGYSVAPVLIAQIPATLIALSIVSGFLRGGFNIMESWFVVREQPVRYRTFTLLQFLSTTLLIIYLVSSRHLGVQGAILGEVASYTVWTVISAYMLRCGGWPNLHLVDWPKIARYCLSLLPHTIFMWAIAYSDRMILQHYVDMKSLGAYEFAFQLASVLSVAALAMRSAWLPSFFRRAGKGEGKQDYFQTASYFFAIVLFIGAGLIAFAPEAIWIMSGGGYAESAPLMRLVVAGLIGFAIFMALNQPLMYEGKNLKLSSASGLAMVTSIGLNLWWVPQYGPMGAALSMLVTYLVLAAFAFILTRHYHRVLRQHETLIGGGLATIAVSLAICALPDMPFVGTFLLKSLFLLVLLATLVFLLIRHRRSATASAVPEIKIREAHQYMSAVHK